MTSRQGETQGTKAAEQSTSDYGEDYTPIGVDNPVTFNGCVQRVIRDSHWSRSRFGSSRFGNLVSRHLSISLASRRSVITALLTPGSGKFRVPSTLGSDSGRMTAYSETGGGPGTLIPCGRPSGEVANGALAGGWLLAGCSQLPILSDIAPHAPARTGSLRVATIHSKP
jgi:hypothetical protein